MAPDTSTPVTKTTRNPISKSSYQKYDLEHQIRTLTEKAKGFREEMEASKTNAKRQHFRKKMVRTSNEIINLLVKYQLEVNKKTLG